jgi:Chitobiase/beta-hexosaminidase C-terminal domain/Legume lectin domain
MSEYSSSRRSAPKVVAATAARTLTGLLVLSLLGLALFCLPTASLLAQTPTPVTVPTWRYDLTHAGANGSETALTPANVNGASFGKLFSVAVDGTLYSQPLYIPGLTINGVSHNVLFVATGHDSVYALDADSNGGSNATPLWQVSLLTAAHGAGAGATTIPWQDTASPDVAPEIGITGTPTINPATNTLYVVAATKENGVYFSRLHALNILTGAEQANSPVTVTATVAGTGNGSSGGQLSFSPLWQNQRSALNFYNGSVYFGYGAHGDNGPWHGWLFAYNGTTLAQTAGICLSPNGTGGGVWESGAGMPIDNGAAGGRMFVAIGNGSFTAYPPFSATTELGESIVDFSLANGGIQATDAFTSFNYAHLNGGDLDQGSGGVLMLPNQQGANQHVLVQAGKEGRILVLNRDNLGGFAGATATSNTNALQDIPNGVKGLWSTPAYWHGAVYMWGNGDVPKRFDFDSGVINPTPSSQSTITSAFPGASFSISANGDQDGIAWAARTDQFNTHGPAVLYAWDAFDLGNLLYESDTDAARDSAGAANRFAIPVVTNGKVYLVANGQVDVYGLFNAEPTAVAPVITPNGGTFATSQSVTLSTTTASASIYYTLDGSVPTPASTLYAGPITISTDTTVNSIASAPGFVQSAVASAAFTFTGQAPAVAFLPAGGTYTASQQVTLSDTDTTANIYYTTDGSAPTAASNLYTAPITVAASTTINAVAVDPNLQNSNVATAAYVIQAAASSTINFGSGFSSTAGLTLNGSTLATNDTRLQLTNGLLDESGSLFWSQPIGIQSFTTDFEFQLSNAVGGADGFTFTIQNDSATVLGGTSGALGYAGIDKSVAIKFDFYNNAGEGDDSTGVYTDGALPTVPAVDLTPSGIELNSGDSISAHVTYDGTTLIMKLLDLVNNKTFTLTQTINIPQVVGGNTAYVGFTGGTGGLTSSQKILTWTYTAGTVAAATATPTFSPAAGTYTTPQTVALSDTTTGAAIYYTTDESMPTTSSHLYVTPITVGASETINAIATSPGSGNSSVATAAYVINVVTVPPSFSLSATPATAIAQGASTTSNITITPSGSFAGSVALSCAVTPSSGTDAPTCSIVSPATIAGTAAVDETLTIHTQAATTAGAYTVTVTGTSGSISETTTAAVTINAAAATPNFSLSNTAISIAAAGTSGTSTITVTPTGGFTGSVALACAITASPAGAVNLPTCSATAPGAISGTTAVTATLTVNTTATSTGALHDPLQRIFTFGGGGALAALFFFGLPVRRQGWKAMLCLLVFSVIAGSGIGCSSGGMINPPTGTTTTTGNGTTTPGTTVGSYTITVTGTSGSTTATTAVIVKVN